MSVSVHEAMLDLGYELKLALLNELCPTILLQRPSGSWFVSQRVEVRRSCFLEGRYGNSSTPEAAILDHWRQLTELASGEYLVANADLPSRRSVRWNGSTWENVA